MHNPFKANLSNTFVNGRGELSNNLDNSRSKVAVQIRKDAEAKAKRQETLKRVRSLSQQIRFGIAEADRLRREGLKLGTDERVEMFAEANEVLAIVRENKAEIRELKKVL